MAGPAARGRLARHARSAGSGSGGLGGLGGGQDPGDEKRVPGRLGDRCGHLLQQRRRARGERRAGGLGSRRGGDAGQGAADDLGQGGRIGVAGGVQVDDLAPVLPAAAQVIAHVSAGAQQQPDAAPAPLDQRPQQLAGQVGRVGGLIQGIDHRDQRRAACRAARPAAGSGRCPARPGRG